MARYIHAERLKDSMLAYYECLEESANGRPYKGDTLMDYEVVDMIEDCIDNAPTADVVEVKHGEWMEHEESFYDGEFHSEYPMKCYKCSECGRVLLNKEPYCNCGAKMNDKE